MKTLNSYIHDLIKQATELNNRTVIFLTGERNVYNLGTICNLIEKLDRKELLYCYVKNNKLAKTQANGRKGSSITQTAKKYLSKNVCASVRWCLYNETTKILGRTFDICVFNDYLKLTPNIIARGVETVRGGGFIIFMAPPLKQLNEDLECDPKISGAHCPRFLKRFTVLLLQQPSCLCIDDKFDLLNNKNKKVKPVKNVDMSNTEKLKSLKESMALSESSFTPLVKACATYDQARCLQSLLTAINTLHDPTNRDTNDQHCPVTGLLTAARGRGKSAALGLAICAALEMGLVNIYITAPDPENIITIWEYINVGLKALNYSASIDFSTESELLSSGVRVTTQMQITRSRRQNNCIQSVRYVSPCDNDSFDCDLLVIDEAAALPCEVLRQYLYCFPNLMFVSSTVSGYEGGAGANRRLVDEVQQCRSLVQAGKPLQRLSSVDYSRGHLFTIELNEPIRYGLEDKVEKYLYKALCISSIKDDTATSVESKLNPKKCRLFHVNRDVLFNADKSQEKVLEQLMSIYTSSQKSQSSPDDLMFLADNSCSFLLLLTDSAMDESCPNIITMIQVCLEGEVTNKYNDNSFQNRLNVASKILHKQTYDNNFTAMSGLRIEFIATHQRYRNHGFGTQAVKLLVDFLSKTKLKMTDKSYLKCSDLLLPLMTIPLIRYNYICVYSHLTVELIRFFRRVADFYVVHLEKESNPTKNEHRGILMSKLHQHKQLQDYDCAAAVLQKHHEVFAICKSELYDHVSDQFKELAGNYQYTGLREVEEMEL